MPKISIITINYNNSCGLRKTIDSVISQPYSDLEFIVIDGGSKDESVLIINEFLDHITYWVSENDKGIYHAMNKGLLESSGDYLLFLNSGDWLVPGVLHKIDQWKLSEDIINFDTYHYYSDSEIGTFPGRNKITMRYLYAHAIMHQSTLIKKSLFEQFGYYDEQYEICGDYDFFMRTIVLGGCETRYIPEYLSYFDRGGISSLLDNKRRKERFSIQEKYLPTVVLEDYEFWEQKQKEIKILLWYKEQKVLYSVLMVGHKIINSFYKQFNYFFKILKLNK